MTEEKKPESARKRRPIAEIAAEKKAWLIRHEWGGVKEAQESVSEAMLLLSKAQTAADNKANGAPWKQTVDALVLLREHLVKLIPPEAR